MNPQIWWYVSRSCGIVAWLMLTGSVLLGVVLATDLFPQRRRPAWLLDLHRWLAGLAILFLAGHLGTLLADKQVRFGALDLAVPFHSSWRSTAVAAGVIAAWLLVAVGLTAFATQRLSKRLWRDIHLLGYWVFWGASVHAALAGTDASKLLYLTTSLVALAAMTFATSYRVLTHHLPKRRHGQARRTPAPSISSAPRASGCLRSPLEVQPPTHFVEAGEQPDSR
jgi:sulfoxide reductase heme-binding subunit YedZ